MIICNESMYEDMVIFQNGVMLKDVLTQEKYSGAIQFRSFLPERFSGEDVLLGFAAYHEGDLVSRDGDTYSFKDFVSRYAFLDGELVVWLHPKYS